MKTDPGGADDMKYAFVNGKILDGSKDMEVREGLNILVENEKIVDIVPAEKGTAGYEKIDLAGRYIMPGLINMHVHLAGNGKPQKKQRDNEKLVSTIMSSALTRAVAYKMVCGFAKDELFICIGGVNALGGLTDAIRELGVREIVEAMDTDQMTNKNVRDAILTMRKAVKKIPGIRYSKYTWNPAYKGVDDYLLSRAAAM